MKSLKRDGKTIQWLKENVQFEQSGSNVYCDEAEYDPQTQDLLGRGNIRITNPDGAIVTGKTLEYNNATHTAKVIGNVKLIDGTMELSTPWIEYNTQTKVGWYGAGGNIIDKETTLSARSGSYNPNKKTLFFKNNVVLTTPEYTVKTDTLQYRTDTKRAQFFAQTQLDYQTKIVVFQSGFYLTDEQKGEFYGQVALFEIDPATLQRTTRLNRGQVAAFSATRDGVVVEWAALDSPPDLYLLEARPRDATQPLRRLTAVNANRLEGRRFSEFEQFSFKGWNEATVYGHVMKPHGYTKGQKYPIAFIVHGGPQVSFANQWSWRWNAQVYAGAGYGVVFIDFHGSPGYGQAFTDSISQDWGGKPLVDLQKGFDAALAKYDWLDGDRACSLGASYGGFMQNWIAGNWPDRFRCIVNHAGIFDQRSMYYGTEELWFTEWENGGPYYAAPRIHEKFNPADYVTRWRTPMLVTHGALDYRVPYIQGLATFTALQRQGVKSRLLFFPDENHWILKPANSIQWHGAVLDWLNEHLKAPDSPKADSPAASSVK